MDLHHTPVSIQTSDYNIMDNLPIEVIKLILKLCGRNNGSNIICKSWYNMNNDLYPIEKITLNRSENRDLNVLMNERFQNVKKIKFNLSTIDQLKRTNVLSASKFMEIIISNKNPDLHVNFESLESKFLQKIDCDLVSQAISKQKHLRIHVKESRDHLRMIKANNTIQCLEVVGLSFCYLDWDIYQLHKVKGIKLTNISKYKQTILEFLNIIRTDQSKIESISIINDTNIFDNLAQLQHLDKGNSINNNIVHLKELITNTPILIAPLTEAAMKFTSKLHTLKCTYKACDISYGKFFTQGTNNSLLLNLTIMNIKTGFLAITDTRELLHFINSNQNKIKELQVFAKFKQKNCKLKTDCIEPDIIKSALSKLTKWRIYSDKIHKIGLGATNSISILKNTVLNTPISNNQEVYVNLKNKPLQLPSFLGMYLTKLYLEEINSFVIQTFLQSSIQYKHLLKIKTFGLINSKINGQIKPLGEFISLIESVEIICCKFHESELTTLFKKIRTQEPLKLQALRLVGIEMNFNNENELRLVANAVKNLEIAYCTTSIETIEEILGIMAYPNDSFKSYIGKLPSRKRIGKLQKLIISYSGNSNITSQRLFRLLRLANKIGKAVVWQEDLLISEKFNVNQNKEFEVIENYDLLYKKRLRFDNDIDNNELEPSKAFLCRSKLTY